MDIEATMISETKKCHIADRIIKQAGLGSRLKAARESMRITEKDAAARLHLNAKIISILENEEFENGPPETFLRGYIRSYARLLNIPDSEICAALTQIAPPIPAAQVSTPTPIINTRPTYNNSHRYLRSMTYVVVGILVVLVSVWWTTHPKDIVLNTKPAPAAATTVVTSTPAAASITATPAPTPVVVTPPTTTKNIVATDPAPQPQVAPPVAVAAPTSPSVPTTQSAPTAPVTTTPNQTVNPTLQQAPVATQDNPTTNGNLDDLDMALSEPGLDQNDDNSSSNSNQPSDENNNNTN